MFALDYLGFNPPTGRLSKWTRSIHLEAITPRDEGRETKRALQSDISIECNHLDENAAVTHPGAFQLVIEASERKG